MKWFSSVRSVDEAKRLYRELAKRYHPDKQGGDLIKMQEINAEYDITLKDLERGGNRFRMGSYDYSKQSTDYSFDSINEFLRKMKEETERQYRAERAKAKEDKHRDLNTILADKEYQNILNKIKNLSGLKIEIIGSWIWVTGNTYSSRELLKELHFWWNSTNKAWYWRSKKYWYDHDPDYDLHTLRRRCEHQTISDNRR